jgi:hypothetical protein
MGGRRIDPHTGEVEGGISAGLRGAVKGGLLGGAASLAAGAARSGSAGKYLSDATKGGYENVSALLKKTKGATASASP